MERKASRFDDCVIDMEALRADCDRAWAEYCSAMSLYGRDSAEVLAAHKEWMQLRRLHEFHVGMAELRRA